MTKEKFSVVPHYEFDPSQRHVTMYPVSLREGALDFPIIAQAVPDRAGVHVLGMGYFTFPSPKRAIAEYWKLPVRQQEVAHAALQARFASGTSLK